MKVILSKKFIVVFLIFCFSVFLRLNTLNQSGQNSDETFCAVEGYNFIQLIKKFDFFNPYWLGHADPPPICRDFYGFFAQFNVVGFNKYHDPILSYDLNYPRLASVALGSLTVVIVALFGWEYISPIVGILGALIFSLNPYFLGLTQLVSQESIFGFLFTFNVYFFMKFLEKPTSKKAFFVGVLIGLALLDKLTNAFIIPVLFLINIIWYKYKLKRPISFHAKYYLKFLFGFILTFMAIWPILFVDPKAIYVFDFHKRFADRFPPWEWFMGQPVQVPVYYYIVQFLVRTPALLLVLFFLAIELRPRKISYALLILLSWFCVPFLQSLYLFKQQGVRYIIEVYAPFSLLVALGIDYFVNIFSKKMIYKVILGIIVLIYSIYSLAKVSPYYLDYFNELVKGVQGVYKHHLFEIGWWSEGGKDAGQYIIKHAKKGDLIGYKTNPGIYMETSNLFKYEPYKSGKKYNYVVTMYAYYQKVAYNNEKLMEDYNEIEKNYTLVHATYVDGVPLYKIYKIKTP